MVDVSVVIPTFRRPVLLQEAVRGALAQTGVSVEVVVVDDSPEGSARAVVDALNDDRVTYTRNDPVSGGRPALVRNVGWPRARGRFIHFLDDDDRPATGFYRAAVRAFEARPDRGVVFGRIEPFGDSARALVDEEQYFDSAARRARLASFSSSRRWMAAILLFQNTVLVNSACMIRRECVAPIGGYDPAIRMNEDVEFYARAIRKFGYVFLDRVVLEYRILPDSLMHGRTDDESLLDAYRLMHERYKRANGMAEWLLMRALCRFL